jgi:hypothetical protein
MWDLYSSAILCSLEWQFLIDVTGQTIAPIFKSQGIQQRKQSMTEVIWHNLILQGLCPVSNFLRKHNVVEAHSVPIFKKTAPNLLEPLDWATLTHWVAYKQQDMHLRADLVQMY